MAIVHEKLSNDLKKLFELSVDTAIELMERDKIFLPFLFRQNLYTKEHVVFTGDDRSNKEAFDKILKTTLSDPATQRFVFTYPGYVKSNEGERSPAVILEGSERGSIAGFVFAKRYTFDEHGSITWLIGNTFLKLSERLRIA